MTTFLKAAQFQRMVRVSADPHETARQIADTQFRPEKTDATEQRKSEPEHAND
jgi:hypothetical protein